MPLEQGRNYSAPGLMKATRAEAKSKTADNVKALLATESKIQLLYDVQHTIESMRRIAGQNGTGVEHAVKLRQQTKSVQNNKIK